MKQNRTVNKLEDAHRCSDLAASSPVKWDPWPEVWFRLFALRSPSFALCFQNKRVFLSFFSPPQIRWSTVARISVKKALVRDFGIVRSPCIASNVRFSSSFGTALVFPLMSIIMERMQKQKSPPFCCNLGYYSDLANPQSLTWLSIGQEYWTNKGTFLFAETVK